MGWIHLNTRKFTVKYFLLINSKFCRPFTLLQIQEWKKENFKIFSSIDLSNLFQKHVIVSSLKEE